MNRRKFLAAIAAGGVMTAEGLWVPGKKLISIPKRLTGEGGHALVIDDPYGSDSTVFHWVLTDQDGNEIIRKSWPTDMKVIAYAYRKKIPAHGGDKLWPH